MSIIENIDRSTFASFEVQGFVGDKNGEEENTFGYFKSSYNDEGDKSSAIETALKTLNDYCKAQGQTDINVTYWDGQVREMMERVKRIRETLPMRTKIDNVFNFCDEEMTDTKLPESEEDLKASITEIAKMDAVLKLKQAEEKKAKLDTIQSEEESRDILSKMLCLERSTGIRNNFEEFMRLLCDNGENTESNVLALPQVEGNVREEQKEDKNKKEEKNRKYKKENQVSPLQKIASKFVERNIKLAKCGRGTLSVTDDEKSRLEDLLGDKKNPAKVAEVSKESKEPEDVEDPCIPEGECFGIDCEIQSALNRIDEQLEVLRNKRSNPVFSLSFLEKTRSEILEKSKSEVLEKIKPEVLEKTKSEVLEQNKSEEKISDEDEKQNVKEKRKKREKTPERLEKINKQLELMNSISREEIKPLSEKEIANLVKQSKRCLSDWKKVGDKPEDPKGEKTMETVIAELVSNAKTMMPKFKYRHGKS